MNPLIIGGRTFCVGMCSLQSHQRITSGPDAHHFRATYLGLPCPRSSSPSATLKMTGCLLKISLPFGSTHLYLSCYSLSLSFSLSLSLSLSLHQYCYSLSLLLLSLSTATLSLSLLLLALSLLALSLLIKMHELMYYTLRGPYVLTPSTLPKVGHCSCNLAKSSCHCNSNPKHSPSVYVDQSHFFTFRAHSQDAARHRQHRASSDQLSQWNDLKPTRERFLQHRPRVLNARQKGTETVQANTLKSTNKFSQEQPLLECKIGTSRSYVPERVGSVENVAREADLQFLGDGVSSGMSPAMLVNIYQEAAFVSLREDTVNNSSIQKKHFVEALENCKRISVNESFKCSNC